MPLTLLCGAAKENLELDEGIYQRQLVLREDREVRGGDLLLSLPLQRRQIWTSAMDVVIVIENTP